MSEDTAAINQPPEPPDDDDDYEFDDEFDDDPDDWELATDSADMVDALVSMIDEKVFEITKTTSFYGQYKRIWGRVVAELSAEYRKRYGEYAEAS
jgi:hypothetical protein